ncbi:SLATT domain-containing protein [Nonomuraea salmonea]|uniref:SLATT domain-containing protein n=1 Tax=Nonomuraea salmonea TaxID=46181 RepID=UPI0031ECDC18
MTYLSRLNAYRRLAHANIAWNAALVALSTSTVIASVGMLVEKNMYGKGGDALMVALAVFSLSISLVVSSVGYGTRAKAMEENYKRIQQISVLAENLKEYTGPDRSEKNIRSCWTIIMWRWRLRKTIPSMIIEGSSPCRPTPDLASGAARVSSSSG